MESNDGFIIYTSAALRLLVKLQQAMSNSAKRANGSHNLHSRRQTHSNWPECL
jgi:hypothetical protein